MTRKLTVANLPKECLVKIVLATRIPVEERLIARAIIEHRLNRASRHVKQYDKIKAQVGKVRSKRRRRDLKIEAQRHAVNFSTLFESARKLAGQFGLTEKYFSGWKEKAGAANTGQTTKRTS